jgi:hypothetical protein
MSRPQSSLKALEIRKALLIAEAQALRTQLSMDLEVVHQGFAAWRAQAKSVASCATIAAAVLAGFSEFRRLRKPEFNGKPSLFSKLLTGARTASSVWTTLRSRPN